MVVAELTCKGTPTKACRLSGRNWAQPVASKALRLGQFCAILIASAAEGAACDSLQTHGLPVSIAHVHPLLDCTPGVLLPDCARKVRIVSLTAGTSYTGKAWNWDYIEQ